MAEEQGTPPQDPGQGTPQAPAPAPTYQSQSPWGSSLGQAFDPETAARVDAWARANVQPYVTRQEQALAEARTQYEQTEGARQLLEAVQSDPHAVNIEMSRQLYGDAYANQQAISLGRSDLIQNAPSYDQYQQPVQPQQQVQAPQPPPSQDENWEYWNNKRLEDEYDQAVDTFLSDPQYADIDKELFDPFVQGAETWEQAVGSYRAWMARTAERFGTQQPGTPQAPPTVGQQGVNDVTPPEQPEWQPPPTGWYRGRGNNNDLNAAIDDVFTDTPPPTIR